MQIVNGCLLMPAIPKYPQRYVTALMQRSNGEIFVGMSDVDNTAFGRCLWQKFDGYHANNWTELGVGSTVRAILGKPKWRYICCRILPRAAQI